MLSARMLTQRGEQWVQFAALGAAHLGLEQRGEIERMAGQLEALDAASSAWALITSPAPESRSAAPGARP